MRKYYIDNIRSLTIILVVIYHVIYIFNSIVVDGVIGPITNTHLLDGVQYILYPWFMLILFIISGMCAKYYLENHSEREFVKARKGREFFLDFFYNYFSLFTMALTTIL